MCVCMCVCAQHSYEGIRKASIFAVGQFARLWYQWLREAGNTDLGQHTHLKHTHTHTHTVYGVCRRGGVSGELYCAESGSHSSD